MRKVKVIIPWRHTEARQAGLEWVVKYYEARFGEGSVHVERDDSAEPFNRSKLLNRGAANYPGHVLVLADGDVFICDFTLREITRQVALNPDRMCIPYTVICRMTASQSAKVLAKNPAKRVSGKWFRSRRKKNPRGGIWIIHHDLWLKHPMDEGFAGWGQEDWDYIERVPHYSSDGPCFHIWHPPADKSCNPANVQRLKHRRAERESQQHPTPKTSRRFLIYKYKVKPKPEISALAAQLRCRGHEVLITEDIRDISKAFDEVVIWNGQFAKDQPAIEKCKDLGVNQSFLETGYFSQRSHFCWTRTGSIGQGLVADGRIPVVTNEEDRQLCQWASHYAFGRERRDEGYTLIMLQLEHDTAIEVHSPIKKMQTLVDRVTEMFPGERIRIKTHPKQKGIRLRTDHEVIRSDDMLGAVLGARRVIGINSTSLYEAAFLGVPVVSLGGSPLHDYPNRHRDIVMEILKRQFPKCGCDDFEERVSRNLGVDLR